jgi:hypothetical protein
MHRQESLRQAPQNPAGRAAVDPGKVVMNLTWSLKLFSDPYSPKASFRLHGEFPQEFMQAS